MANGKKSRGRYVGIPYLVANSDAFAALRAPEVKLLIDLLLQFNGNNNGMQSACLTLMQKRGWAATSLYRAFNNLQHAGLVVITRQGWKCRGKPTLVAFTWAGIDEPKNGVEYDSGIIPSHTPLGYWCKEKSGWKHKPKAKEITKNETS